MTVAERHTRLVSKTGCLRSLWGKQGLRVRIPVILTDVQHYVYCIENLINHKIYVGKHSTEDVNDGYMGGGKHIKRAIAKYGVENFKKHVLKDDFESSEDAFEFEKQLITQELVVDNNTYNLKPGGEGGSAKGFLTEDARKKQAERMKTFVESIVYASPKEIKQELV